VAIDTEDRDKDQVGPIQQMRLAIEGNVTQQHHTCVLAVDLAGVDARLDQDGRLGRIELGTVFRGDDGIDVAAFRRGAEAFDADQVGCGIQTVKPCAGIGIVGAEVQFGILFEPRGPFVGCGAQQVTRAAFPFRRGRQELLIPGGDVGDGCRF